MNTSAPSNTPMRRDTGADHPAAPSEVELLRRNELRLRALVENMPDNIVLYDADFRVLVFNAAHAATLRRLYDADIAAGMRMADHFPEGKQADVESIMARALGGERFSLEMRVVDPAGYEVFLEHSFYPIIESDRVVAIGQYTRDVTHRRNAENRLTQLSLALEQSPAGIVITNLAGTAEYANRRFRELTGFARDEILGSCPIRMLLTWSGQESIDDIHARIRAGQEWRGEVPFVTKSGEVLTALCDLSPVKSKDGFVTHYLMVVQDVTREKLLELEKSRQEHVLQGVAEMARELLASPSFAEGIGPALRATGEAVAADRAIIFALHEDPDASTREFVRRHEWADGGYPADGDDILRTMSFSGIGGAWYESLSRGKPVQVAVRNLSAGDRRVLESCRIRVLLALPIFVKDGYWGFLGLCNCHDDAPWSDAAIVLLSAAATNIGAALDREKASEALIESKNKAEESDRVKSSVLATISHELRSPLNGILGFAAVLRTLVTDPDLADIVGSIDTSAHRLLATLDSVLTLAQLEGAALRVQKSQVAPGVVLDPLIEEYTALAAAKGITFTSDLEQAPASVWTDPQLLSTTLSKLLDNAVKFTPSGEIRIIVTTSASPPSWEIQVRDSGIGIPDQALQMIFEPFRQGSEGFGRHFEGMGLGLAIVKDAVNALGGTITCESYPDAGSIFTLSFPEDKEGAMDTNGSDNIPDIDIPDFDTLNAALGRPARVLIVEDNDLNAILSKSMLKMHCDVEVAANGLIALDMCAAGRFDLVLMDINLGAGIDGIATTHRMRRIAGYENLPVAALTGYTLKSERERILAAGLTHYLEKPFVREDLQRLVRIILAEQCGLLG